ncbi:MAG: hypothetical protein KKH52_00745, partial [Nanoarchaeota archaeon]|nr:hypothetical protein [Nanoarchaeota archaeon]
MQIKRVILILVVIFLFFSFCQTYVLFTLTGQATGNVAMCIIGAPNITTIPNQNATIGIEFSYPVNCSQDCGETLYFYDLTIPNLPSFNINSSIGIINFTPQLGESGAYDIYVYCDKIGFTEDSEHFVLNVNCTINPPIVQPIVSQTARIDQEFSYQVECNSDCYETLTFYHVSVPNLPSFNISSSTGLINFTPQSGEDGTYNIHIYCDKSGFSPNSTTFQLNVLCATTGPLTLNSRKHIDNESVILNWSSVDCASYYNIYYSSNISSIMNLNLSNVTSDVTSVTGISILNWTDTNASEVQKRYYTVSAVVSGNETLTNDLPVGKFTYYYTAPNSSIYGTLASNRIAIYLNVSYIAESFLQEIPGTLNPTIS